MTKQILQFAALVAIFCAMIFAPSCRKGPNVTFGDDEINFTYAQRPVTPSTFSMAK